MGVPVANEVQLPWVPFGNFTLFSLPIWPVSVASSGVAATRAGRLDDSNVGQHKSCKELPTGLTLPPVQLPVLCEMCEHFVRKHNPLA